MVWLTGSSSSLESSWTGGVWALPPAASSSVALELGRPCTLVASSATLPSTAAAAARGAGAVVCWAGVAAAEEESGGVLLLLVLLLPTGADDVVTVGGGESRGSAMVSAEILWAPDLVRLLLHASACMVGGLEMLAAWPAEWVCMLARCCSGGAAWTRLKMWFFVFFLSFLVLRWVVDRRGCIFRADPPRSACKSPKAIP